MSTVKLHMPTGVSYEYVEFEGTNVSEVLGMRDDYLTEMAKEALLNVGVDEQEVQGEGPKPSTPATTFLSRAKGVT